MEFLKSELDEKKKRFVVCWRVSPVLMEFVGERVVLESIKDWAWMCLEGENTQIAQEIRIVYDF